MYQETCNCSSSRRRIRRPKRYWDIDIKPRLGAAEPRLGAASRRSVTCYVRQRRRSKLQQCIVRTTPLCAKRKARSQTPVSSPRMKKACCSTPATSANFYESTLRPHITDCNEDIWPTRLGFASAAERRRWAGHVRIFGDGPAKRRGTELFGTKRSKVDTRRQIPSKAGSGGARAPSGDGGANPRDYPRRWAFGIGYFLGYVWPSRSLTRRWQHVLCAPHAALARLMQYNSRAFSGMAVRADDARAIFASTLESSATVRHFFPLRGANLQLPFATLQRPRRRAAPYAGSGTEMAQRFRHLAE